MKLIEKTSPLYLKRLVKNLNYQLNGFYLNGLRYSNAKFVKPDRIALFSLAGQKSFVDNLVHDPSQAVFSDPYGCEIVASRTTLN